MSMNSTYTYCPQTLFQENTFQAILITDGTYSYTVFTYKCGLMEWGSSVTIGYNAAGDSYDNYDPSSPEIACLNYPLSNWSNVVYLLSNDSSEFPPPGMPYMYRYSLLLCQLFKYCYQLRRCDSFGLDYGVCLGVMDSTICH